MDGDRLVYAPRDGDPRGRLTAAFERVSDAGANGGHPIQQAKFDVIILENLPRLVRFLWT